MGARRCQEAGCWSNDTGVNPGHALDSKGLDSDEKSGCRNHRRSQQSSLEGRGGGDRNCLIPCALRQSGSAPVLSSRDPQTVGSPIARPSECHTLYDRLGSRVARPSLAGGQRRFCVIVSSFPCWGSLARAGSGRQPPRKLSISVSNCVCAGSPSRRIWFRPGKAIKRAPGIEAAICLPLSKGTR